MRHTHGNCVFELRSTCHWTQYSPETLVLSPLFPLSSLSHYVHEVRYISLPAPVSSQHNIAKTPDNGGQLCRSLLQPGWQTGLKINPLFNPKRWSNVWALLSSVNVSETQQSQMWLRVLNPPEDLALITCGVAVWFQPEILSVVLALCQSAIPASTRCHYHLISLPISSHLYFLAENEARWGCYCVFPFDGMCELKSRLFVCIGETVHIPVDTCPCAYWNCLICSSLCACAFIWRPVP